MFTLRDMNGTTATEEQGKSDVLANYNVTSTPYVDRYLLLKEINRKIEKSKVMEQSPSDLNELEALIDLLPNNSDEHLECMFKLRVMKKAVKRKASSSIGQENQKNNPKGIETSVVDYLIKEDYHPFVNIGKEGRKWVSQHLSGNEGLVDKEVLIKEVDKHIGVLNDYISQLQTTHSKEEVDRLMVLLHVDIGKTSSVKENVISSWIESDTRKINNLSQVHKKVESIKDQGIYTSLISEEDLAYNDI